MACDRCNCYFSFWDIFFSFTPLTARKMKTSKKRKKAPGDIIILNTFTKNHDHIQYCSWDLARDKSNWFFSFWAIFWSFSPLTAQKIKIKKKKLFLEISSFYTCVSKIIVRWCTVPEMWCTTNGQTDGWTNGWTDGRTNGKSDIQRWVPHLKKLQKPTFKPSNFPEKVN